MLVDAPSAAKGIVFDIKRYALHDGPGIRTTVFLKGCPLRCWWCHNPESRELQPENHTRTCRLGDHAFLREEKVGQWMSVQEVLTRLEEDRLFYDESGGGVTFSGGEPLMQIRFLEALLLGAREREFHLCLDTSGFTTPEKFDRILPLVDLFLFDLKVLDNRRHLFYTGVSNQSILQNLQALMRAGKPVIIRFPVIPSITDTDQNLKQMKDWLNENGWSILRLDLLPYHDIARGKYQRFLKKNKMSGIAEPPAAYIRQLQSYFAETGVQVGIGG